MKPAPGNEDTEEGFAPEDLLARVGQTQDRAAFARLFGHYAPRLKSWLLRQGADESTAEEIVQGTFIAVWEKAARFDPAKAAASTWIFTIARNRRIDMLRRAHTVLFDSGLADIVSAGVADEAEEAYGADVSAARLAAALDALPPDQARVLRMAFFEDKSHSAIAQETDLPLGTVKSRLRLGLEKLRRTLRGGHEA